VGEEPSVPHVDVAGPRLRADRDDGRLAHDAVAFAARNQRPYPALPRASTP
jgi:hypothetical protein